ncbi:ribose-phosphate diphosphokinase [Ensifer sesbaniae]|uniref:ribose-phosphate diphosphokinase n=1 Tax=Ensifer sesbaniae TaxID=1214071 RepID=UPI00156A1DAD|nr:ribose-phosphate diphosphokinase [Ensifer sesbaniae]MCK3781018.1 ribose-phosphate diphosphokinase [Ensifer sesbaniae]NRQ12917.1 Ribose-phosphate pyrophosphokinase [Ensifer sesbaniae]
MRIFALNGTKALGRTIADHVGVALAEHEERDFEGGEHKARPLVSVRGEDVYLIHTLNGAPDESANDKLCKLLFFAATCRENGASRVTVVTPYLAYSRKDRQTKARDPVTTRYVAQLFEAVGVNTVVTLDVHNLSAFQNAFRCCTVHLNTRRLFSETIARLAGSEPVLIFSPDAGGIKRAQLLKESYELLSGNEAQLGIMEKRRSRGVVSGHLFAGDVQDAVVFVVDDMIGTGGTMLRAAEACRERGAKTVYVLAAHGLFDRGVEAVLAHPAIDRTIVTDSASPFHVSEDILRSCVEIIPSAPLFGEAIRRLHSGGSIAALSGDDD